MNIRVNNEASGRIDNTLNNAFFGYKAGNYPSTAGTNNTAIGHQALYQNISGGYNTAIGNLALSQNISGGYNVGVGYNAQVPDPSNSNQIAIGTSNETMYIQGGFNYNSTISATTIYVSGSLSGHLKQFYTVNDASGAITITLPLPGPQYIGSVINFRRLLSATTTITFNVSGGGSLLIIFTAYTIATSATLLQTQMSTTFICDGTYWFQMQTI